MGTLLCDCSPVMPRRPHELAKLGWAAPAAPVQSDYGDVCLLWKASSAEERMPFEFIGNVGVYTHMGFSGDLQESSRLKVGYE